MESEASIPPECEGCGAELVSHLFCFSCKTLQHFPPTADYFEALGLSYNYRLDQEKLKKRYHQLAEELHPDFYANSSKDLQHLSERGLALINRAFEFLLDPFSRAEYLLRKIHPDLEEKERIMPPDFLEEMFSLQEKLDQLVADHDRQGVEQMRMDLEQDRSELESGLLPAFEMLEEAEKPQEVLERLRMSLNTNQYLKRLLERCVIEETE